MTPSMTAAFLSGSGANAASVGSLIVLIVGAVAVLWLAAVVLGVGKQGLIGATARAESLSGTVRAAIVVMLLIYLLS